MAFIQIIEMRSKNFDELQALGDEFFAATEGKRTVAALSSSPATATTPTAT